ncbi:MAG TPA: polysaccharide deacetylase family protein [Steroidobacteraceae bacterium]|jgi:peptidoglycan/xylan/chitin deacetylase (PgdA/CDA1 family)|nr:polysaccharide deacetylase family protein [Steroidobacteraceae bacterium]
MTVTLSFDNGPDARVTPYVLDILRERKLRATFFVLGAKLRDRRLRVVAERAVSEGHRLGNHTFSHHIQFGLIDPPERAVSEIQRAQALIGPLAGHEKLFRPFGGGGIIDRNLLNGAALTYLRDEKFTVALWTCVPGDWAEPDGWQDRAMACIQAERESVVVLHDLPTGAMRHLASFIERIDAVGRPVIQDFPDSVIPVRDGVVTPQFETLFPSVVSQFA